MTKVSLSIFIAKTISYAVHPGFYNVWTNNIEPNLSA